MRFSVWAGSALLGFQALVGSTQRSGADRLITCVPRGPFARGSLGDDLVRGQIPLTAENLMLAGDGRVFSPCLSPLQPGSLTRTLAEVELIVRGSRSADANLRRLAVTAQGRLGPANGGGPSEPALRDPDPLVRLAAADALANVLLPFAGEFNEPPAPPAATQAMLVKRGRDVLLDMLQRESVDQVAAVILESLGRLRLDEPDAGRLERTLITESNHQSPVRALGAVKGLEAFVRANPKHELSENTRRQLRELSIRGRDGAGLQSLGGRVVTSSDVDILARTRRLTMQILQSSRDPSVPTVIAAADDPDWQVRRLAVQRMDATVPDFDGPLSSALRDDAFQVRLEAVKIIGRRIERTKLCSPLLDLTGDQAPQVAMQALDLLPVGCDDGEKVALQVATLAEGLRSGANRPWQVPARALAALGRLNAPQTSELNAVAVEHPVWQVRALATAVAGALTDETTVLRLADDLDPNVRSAALEALSRMKSPALVEVAVRVLRSRSTDEQLIRTAAILLKPEDPVDQRTALDALFEALGRLTRLRRDTSRDARLALITRIEAIDILLDMPPDNPSLAPYCIDVDPKVAALALKVFPPPSSDTPPPPRWRHYPAQPSAGDLPSLPRTATLLMADGAGMIELELLSTAAPVTVARFTALAREHYYDGLTFHRVVPNFVIQGGSPGANEYVGDKYYMRDEIGPTPHLRGSVGLSTRGHDTGDAQFFIDLVDLPRLDHEYTVFARVVNGLDVVDRVLEGAKIETVTVR